MTTGARNEGIATILSMGLFRAALVNGSTYPLDVIKTNQQTSGFSATRIAHDLFKSEGLPAFYRGFAANMAKVVTRQTLWWPAIAYIPPALEQRGISGTPQRILTGLSIAALDALATTPFERRRVVQTLGKEPSSLQGNWTGLPSYFRRQAVIWSLFLVGQHYVTKKDMKNGAPLTGFQILLASAKLSVVANLVITPLDTLHILRQSQSDIRPKLTIRFLYRGLPLNALMMHLQTAATIFVMDKIGALR